MSLSKLVRNALYEPKLKNVRVDDPNLLLLHSSILKEKPMLRETFSYFYRKMLSISDQFIKSGGLEIELGSWAGFFKDINPSVLTSDIRYSPNYDLILDAQKMDLKDSSVRCIYAINVFHHLPDPVQFFKELERVLVAGGGCILIEPHGGAASAALHKRLHKDEYFDPDSPGWENYQVRGPFSGANQALSHIVFSRDLDWFNREFGSNLALVHREYCTNGLRYLLSGGLNFRQLVPNFISPIVPFIEWLISPLARFWSFHEIIVIQRR
jgi:SAM-dependent methyltransferase